MTKMCKADYYHAREVRFCIRMAKSIAIFVGARVDNHNVVLCGPSRKNIDQLQRVQILKERSNYDLIKPFISKLPIDSRIPHCSFDIQGRWS